MSALEKAARALAEANSTGIGVYLYDSNPELYQRLARAVLMAVRSDIPPHATRKGCVVIEDWPVLENDDPRITDGYDIFIPVAEQTFTAMIDAIVNEGQNE